MQRAVLKEDILDQTGIDISVEHFTSMLINGQIDILLNTDQRPRLFLRHIHASQDNRGNKLPFVLFVVVPFRKYFSQELPSSVRTERHQKTAYLILKQDHQDKETDTDKLVEYRSHQAHLQHLGNQNPNNNKRHYSTKDSQSTGILHQLICLVQEEGYQ